MTSTMTIAIDRTGVPTPVTVFLYESGRNVDEFVYAANENVYADYIAWCDEMGIDFTWRNLASFAAGMRANGWRLGLWRDGRHAGLMWLGRNYPNRYLNLTDCHCDCAACEAGDYAACSLD